VTLETCCTGNICFQFRRTPSVLRFFVFFSQSQNSSPKNIRLQSLCLPNPFSFTIKKHNFFSETLVYLYPILRRHITEDGSCQRSLSRRHLLPISPRIIKFIITILNNTCSRCVYCVQATRWSPLGMRQMRMRKMSNVQCTLLQIHDIFSPCVRVEKSVAPTKTPVL
jgi:hypothetical protein